MPKELFHLHIGHTLLPHFTNWISQKDRNLFLMATIFPDAFFYSPFARFSDIGRTLHSLEGKNFIELIMNCKHTHVTPALMPIILGMGAHFFTDGLWHPAINKAGHSISKSIGCSQLAAHILLESFNQRWFITEIEEKELLSFIRKGLKTSISTAERFYTVLKVLLDSLNVSYNVTPLRVLLTIDIHLLFLLGLHSRAFSTILWKRITSGPPPGNFISIMAPHRTHTHAFINTYDSLLEGEELFSRKFYSSRLTQLTNLFHELQGLLK